MKEAQGEQRIGPQMGMPIRQNPNYPRNQVRWVGWNTEERRSDVKGEIFTHFLKMVDEVFSPEMTEKIIDKANPPSGGAYTSVGAYDHAEIIALVGALSELSGAEVPALVRAFGEYLFGELSKAHPEYIEKAADAFCLLENLHSHIHVDVRKIYPDAELPSVESIRHSDDRLTVNYTSERPFASVAEGLICGCIKHFGEAIDLKCVEMSEDGTHAVFELRKAA